MGEPPVPSRSLRYAVLVALWVGYLAIMWVALEYVPASQPAKDATTFLVISGTLALWSELSFRLVQGTSLWDPRAWSV